MKIKLSDHFTYKKLFRFTLPSIAMMLFTSVYGVVDGFFVSNYAGKTPFAALNLIMPFIMLLGTGGFLFGTGGSALVSKTMGEGKSEKAKELFSLFVYVPLILSLLVTAAGIVFLPRVARLLGADEILLPYCVQYGRIVLSALPAFTLQMEFQTFFVTAEKPQLGFRVTVAAGVANMLLDFLFVGVFGWGLAGAAFATAISQTVGGVVPVIYFLLPNSSRLRLTKTTFDAAALFRGITNGFSELMTNVSMSLVGMLYNIQLLKYIGENGVAAYGTIMYIDFIFLAVFIGYSIGTAPVISFHYGAQNEDELKNLFRKSLMISLFAGVLMSAFALLFSHPLAGIFSGYDENLLELTVHGFRIYALSFFASGVTIFASSFFTALNNGAVSALISFLRTVVFEAGAVLLLPRFLGADGIWVAIVAARFLALCVAWFLLFFQRKNYGY